MLTNETKYCRSVRATVISVLRGKQDRSALPWHLLQFSDYDLICLLAEMRSNRRDAVLS
jgi:hypothetical protein